MKYTQTFLLKQHTPIIHFLSQDEGATLRPTELKPKLDRFLFHQFASEGQEVPVQWLVGKGKASHARALDYQVRVQVEGRTEVEDIPKGDKNLPMFFGNMGDEYDKHPKSLVSTQGQVRVSLFCLIPELQEWLEMYFPAFIAQTNFGTRQNKGFGSFSLWNEETQQVIDLNASVEAQTPYMSIRKSGLIDILTTINYYYQRLKSGINYRNHYQRAFLREYLGANQNYTWEKRWLKEKFLGLEADQDEKRFARALMGLPGSITFRPSPTDPVAPKYEMNIEISEQTEQISRIKSPLTFKPVIYGRETRIYIFAHEYTDSEKEILGGKPFHFAHGHKTERLETPRPDQFFLMQDLLTQYHNHLDHKFEARDFTGRNTITVNLQRT